MATGRLTYWQIHAPDRAWLDGPGDAWIEPATSAESARLRVASRLDCDVAEVSAEICRDDAAMRRKLGLPAAASPAATGPPRRRAA